MQGALPNLLSVTVPPKRVDRPKSTIGPAEEPLSPLVVCSENVQSDHDAVVDYTLASLDAMQFGLAKAIASALQVQLEGLSINLKQLGEEEERHMSPKTPKTPRTTHEIFAAAIKASLDPKFDSLDREASDLTQQIPHSARETAMLCSAASPRIAASVADELLPEITDDIAATIDNIFSARISGFKKAEADIPKPSTRTLRVQIDSRHQSKESHSTALADDSGNSQLRGATLSLPPDALRQASSDSLVGMTTRHSDIMRNRQPERAFVVNFRRLVEIQKVLSLIHLIIKSTAIATLTLVSCGFWTDFLSSVLFVGSVLGIYAVHEIRHDGMDIEDYKALSGLMEDDNGTYRGANGEAINVENPNRLLKALTLSKNLQRRRRSGITIICLVLFILVMWAAVFVAWSIGKPDNGKLLGILYEDEIAVMATQMLIGTVMLLFHGIFEWLYWRETQCVMPYNEKKERPWDPRNKRGDGVPPSYSWFGLPSMWFTSREAYDDLRLWITIATSSNLVSHVETKIFPEEMALFALDPDNACDLRRTLKHAKLFSLADWEYQARESDPSGTSQQSSPRQRQVQLRSLQVGQAPEELQVELALYDSATGQFLEPHHHKEYRSGLVQLLANKASPRDRALLHTESFWASPDGTPKSFESRTRSSRLPSSSANSRKGFI